MSTQTEDGIPLSFVAEHDRKHFRLLELPPEILTLLISDTPPILELKSSGIQGADDAGTAVLCTHDKTFNLRQKNSSNTVYLLQPHSRSDFIAGSTLQAIAQCHSSLELTATNPSDGSALDHMKTVLPIYSSTGLAASSSLNQRALFNLIPYSEQECLQAFRELAAFAQPSTDHVYRPSAALAVQAWQNILTTVVAQGVDLNRPLTASALTSLIDADSESEAVIAQAILDLFTNPTADGMAFDQPDRCVLWVGRQLLEAEAARNEIPSRVFLEKWKDLLPEKWRPLADLSTLAAVSQSSDGGKSIMLKGAVAAASTPAQSIVAASAAGNKRKWHEKFRPSKK
ncbi:hypothetical protein AMS68_004707 [Peltaster fructicola]|uniref:Sister chromatid cohesion protein Dcc1 n=1 Tax=Peltaster fructicola TaxID=286661 RepID=A0A6H0XXP4_9PEZI|nr:hypothetical protein AMS68_004707 [Peltaster fructicola]